MEEKNTEELDDTQDDNQDDESQEESIDDVKKELEETKAKLAKLEEKDLNFSKLRNKKEEELSEEKRAELSEIEQTLLKRQEDLEEKQNKFLQSQKDTMKGIAMSRYATNEEEIKKFNFHYNRLSDPDDTQEQIEAKAKDAAKLAGIYKESVDIGNVNSRQGQTFVTKPKDNSRVESLGRELGLKSFTNKKK